jgi:hypothetical protein
MGKMTNREAFKLYYREQVYQSIEAVEGLSNEVFLLWMHDNPNARCGANVEREFNWFWFTYGGRDSGKGIDNVSEWLRKPFKGNIVAEHEKWKKRDYSWVGEINKKYEVVKE